MAGVHSAHQGGGGVNSTTHRLGETDAISNNPEKNISMETHATDCQGLFYHTHMTHYNVALGIKRPLPLWRLFPSDGAQEIMTVDCVKM